MDIVSATIVLFLVMDAPANVPMFLAVLRTLPPDAQRRVILREMLIALGILMAFLFFGQFILRAMNISEPALGIAGGVVLMLIAIRMVFPRRREPIFGDEDTGGAPVVVPLAVPLVAGPAAMTTVMLLATRDPDRILEWALALLVAWGLSLPILLASEPIQRALGDRGLRAVTRLMGMILTVMAVQMMLNGFSVWLTGLGLVEAT